MWRHSISSFKNQISMKCAKTIKMYRIPHTLCMYSASNIFFLFASRLLLFEKEIAIVLKITAHLITFVNKNKIKNRLSIYIFIYCLVLNENKKIPIRIFIIVNHIFLWKKNFWVMKSMNWKNIIAYQ